MLLIFGQRFPSLNGNRSSALKRYRRPGSLRNRTHGLDILLDFLPQLRLGLGYGHQAPLRPAPAAARAFLGCATEALTTP